TASLCATAPPAVRSLGCSVTGRRQYSGVAVAGLTPLYNGAARRFRESTIRAEETVMTRRPTTRAWAFALGAAALSAASTVTSGQQEHYPVTIIAPGKGPFSFPPGYQTPWE